MAKQTINVGTADKGNGDPLRTAFIKVNSNFNELYAALGADLTSVASHIIPETDDTYDLGSATHKWRSLYVSSNTIYLDNIPLSVVDGVLKLDSQTVGGTPAWSDITGKPAIPSTLDSLTDVFITGASSGQVLKYDGSNWVNGTDNSGGGSGSISVGDGQGPSVENVTEILINGTITEIEPGLVGISVSGSGSIQPYLELTNDPFIIQPVTFGEPFTVTAPVSGQGATFNVIIGAGPLLTLVAVASPGTGYVVGQRYKIWYNNIGGNTSTSYNITFEIETVGESGEILTIVNPQFSGSTGDNVPGNYSGVSIELTSSVRDEISPGVVLTRSLNQALYNLVSETEYDNSNYLSPLNTEWNSDGWDNLVGIGGRSFTTFRAALGGQVGNNVVGAELVMRDTTTDRYYKFEFTDWGQNNGGSYTYTRTEITDPNFFRKTDDGDEVDIFVADDGLGAGIGITRGAEQSIYNPYREEGYVEEDSPAGTLWNIGGWDDLSDVESRTYTNFYAAYGGGLGNRVPGSKTVMYIPETDTYYAIQWLSWTQNANGGGFTYVRYELDLTQINEGVKFPDGSVLKSAAGVGRVKSTASAGRRIEEVVGSNTVSITAVTTSNITAAASRSVTDSNQFWVSSTATEIAQIFNDPNSYGIQDLSTMEFSLDNVTWYPYDGGYSSTGTEIGVTVLNANVTYNEGDTIYFRYDTGGAPQVWWDKADLPGGSSDFRGAVIDYHAYTGEATIIGTIHIVDDSGEQHISHTEVASGSTDSENDDLWLVQNEGTISYRRIDGESKTLKIHWTAKVFYGTEFWD
jgi:hypothetical protein